jgi:NitT/TauT family transport system substrate-binding protein
MKKTITLILVGALLCLCFAGFASCSNKKTEDGVIRLNETTHSVFYAPLYAAINLGYFDEYGLTIELTNGGGSDKSMTALVSGGADIGLLGPETALYLRSQNGSNGVKIIGQLTQKDGSFLIGRTEQKDFKWSDLKNKNVIGGRKGGMPAMCLEYAVAQNGLTDGVDVTINYDVQFDLITAAFESNVGDYCTMFEPSASQYQTSGKGYIVASVGKEVGNVAYTCFMATEKYLSENGETAENFMRAVIKGIDYCHSHTAQEIADAIQPSFATTDNALLVKALTSYMDIDAWTAVPYMTTESFDRLQSILLRAGTLTAEIAYADVVDNAIIDKILS